LALGQITHTLPFIRKKAEELLKINYASDEEASRVIPAELTRWARRSTSHP